MEGGGVGPTTSHSSRPVRSSARFYYNSTNTTNSSPANFSGPVRRWEKKWVHVSPSPPLKPRTKHTKNNNNPNANADKSSILLCKWTPLSSSANTGTTASPGRKFRYTPIGAFEGKKKLAAKGLVDGNYLGEVHQSVKNLAMDSDDIYRMLDINQDQMEDHLGGSKSILTQYSRRSHVNHGSYLED